MNEAVGGMTTYEDILNSGVLSTETLGRARTGDPLAKCYFGLAATLQREPKFHDNDEISLKHTTVLLTSSIIMAESIRASVDVTDEEIEKFLCGVNSDVDLECLVASIIEFLTESEFDALTNESICHLGLSYDDRMGMRYFQNINDSGDNCTN